MQLQEEQMWEHYGRNYDKLQACLNEARKVVPVGDSKEDIAGRRTRHGSAARLSTDVAPGDVNLLEALPLTIRLENIRSGKQEVQTVTSHSDKGTMQKNRADVYKQTFLHVKRAVDHQVEGRISEEDTSRLAATRIHKAKWPKAAFTD